MTTVNAALTAATRATPEAFHHAARRWAGLFPYPLAGVDPADQYPAVITQRSASVQREPVDIKRAIAPTAPIPLAQNRTAS